MTSIEALLNDIRGCTLCAGALPHGVRPVVQAGKTARILIAGQAPGRRVHESGIPFDDTSGDRLRDWMGVTKETFYDAERIAIAPMGFCFPGTGKSGDMPPRHECAPAWREQLLKLMPDIELTLVIGQYAVKWHMPHAKEKTLTDAVKSGPQYIEGGLLPLPHPSPRNNIWMSKNPWFSSYILPVLKEKVSLLLS